MSDARYVRQITAEHGPGAIFDMGHGYMLHVWAPREGYVDITGTAREDRELWFGLLFKSGEAFGDKHVYAKHSGVTLRDMLNAIANDHWPEDILGYYDGAQLTLDVSKHTAAIERCDSFNVKRQGICGGVLDEHGECADAVNHGLSSGERV